MQPKLDSWENGSLKEPRAATETVVGPYGEFNGNFVNAEMVKAFIVTGE